MTYDELITSIYEIVDNEHITKTGLTITYELDSHNHRKMDEEIHIRTQNPNQYIPCDIISLTIETVNIKIIRKTING